MNLNAKQIYLMLYFSVMDHSHSDNNLVELGSETIKEDDRAVLLEGGLTKSASAKFNSSAVKANIIRLLLDNKYHSEVLILILP